MGVPALFRWLNNKYPKITTRVIEESPLSQESPPHTTTINTALPNPNGFETDNLYLDMNGIIHPCCHSEFNDTPATEEGMFMEIFKYTDRIFNMVRPRNLLYFAVDGVAPRAKMNQQRSRRFRAAQDASAKSAIAEKTREELIASGRLKIESNDTSVNPNESSKEDDIIVHPFDKNCITPGTQFMANLKLALEYYIIERMSNDPGWKNIRVILSDSSVPGEGEHKIMSFIRHQKHSPTYNPNTSHVMYGLDADLIMLALATHEVHFKVLREDVFFEEAQKRNLCYRCQSPGHTADNCTRELQNESTTQTNPISTIPKPFIYLDVYTLREYLYYEFRSDNFSPKLFSFERLIDDWIFLIFFVGNDFLPHLPSLEIHEGAIDMLLDIYKKNWTGKLENGYLTDEGLVDVKRVKSLLSEIGKEEDIIFIKRRAKEEQFEANRKRRKLESSVIPTVDKTSSEEPIQKEAGNIAPHENANATSSNTSFVSVDEEGQELIDEVRLWEQGAKERYYLKKFDKTLPKDEYFVTEMTEAYIAGVCWVMAYYYRGCVSWNWFYPYHYAPFASDFELVDAGKKIEFALGQPFRPFEQLLGVLPSASHKLLPEPYHRLMNDPLSELIDFYPLDFQVDLNGKKQAWKGVALLPFIEEDRLLKAAERIVPDLSAQDVVLNDFGEAVLYIHENHPDANIITHLYAQPKEMRQGFTRLITDTQIETIKSINPLYTESELCPREGESLEESRIISGSSKDAIDGWVEVLESDAPLPGASYHSRLAGLPVSGVPVNSVLAVIYLLPYYDKVLPFKARLMMGVELPKSTITQDDFLTAKQSRGNSYGRNRSQYGNNSSYGSGSRGGYGELHVQSYHGSYREPSWKGNYQDRSYSHQRPYDRPPYQREQFDHSPVPKYSHQQNVRHNQYTNHSSSTSREYQQYSHTSNRGKSNNVTSTESTGNRYEQYMDRLLAQGAPSVQSPPSHGSSRYPPPHLEREKRPRNYP